MVDASIIFAILSLAAVWLLTLVLTRLLKPKTRVQFWLSGYLIINTLILLTGYLASGLHRLNDLWCWALIDVVMLAAVLVPVWRHRPWREIALVKPNLRLPELRRYRPRTFWHRADSWLLAGTGGAVAVVMLINLTIIAQLKPSTFDVLEYHLPRMIAYLQQGHLGHFPAAYWAEVVHPKISTVLMAYLYLITGRQDQWTQFTQYVAYAVCLLAVYGIARHLGASRRGSALAGLAFGLLTTVIAQGATGQNDLLLTAFVGCALYFVLMHRAAPRFPELLLALLGLGLAIGVKATGLAVLPAVAVILIGLYRRRQATVKTSTLLTHAALALLLVGIIVVLPSGYLENLLRYGHPIGPASVRAEHTFDSATPGVVLGQGIKNVARFSLNFLSVDGLAIPEAAPQAQRTIFGALKRIDHSQGWGLDDKAHTRLPFTYDREFPVANENYSYWGVLGFLLIWPVVWLAIVGLVRTPLVRTFALAAVVFVLTQAFAGPYDPWRARYFITAALFALPPLALAISTWRHPIARAWFAVAIGLGAVSALVAAGIRYDFFVFDVNVAGHQRRSTLFTPIDARFPADKYQVISGLDTSEYYAKLTQAYPYTRYDFYMSLAKVITDLVIPQDAAVAIDSKAVLPLYLFTGEHQTRRLFSVRDIDDTPVPTPNATWIIFSTEQRDPEPGDVPIFHNHEKYGSIFVRRLTMY